MEGTSISLVCILRFLSGFIFYLLSRVLQPPPAQLWGWCCGWQGGLCCRSPTNGQHKLRNKGSLLNDETRQACMLVSSSDCYLDLLLILTNSTNLQILRRQCCLDETWMSGIPSMPSSLGSMKMEAMAKPRKTRAPRKVIFLIEMNLGFDYTIIYV